MDQYSRHYPHQSLSHGGSTLPATPVEPKPATRTKKRYSSFRTLLIVASISIVLALALHHFGFTEAISNGLNQLFADSSAPVVSGDPSHGDTLAEVLSNIRDEDYEFFAAFDRDNKKIYEYTSKNRDSVELTESMLNDFCEQGGITIAHNHPDHNAPFSVSDLHTSGIWQAEVSIVVTTDYDYYLVAPNGKWPSRSEIHDWENQHNLSDNPDYYRCVGDELDLATGQIVQVFISTDLLLESFANDFGMKFCKLPAQHFCKTEITAPIK